MNRDPLLRLRATAACALAVSLAASCSGPAHTAAPVAPRVTHTLARAPVAPVDTSEVAMPPDVVAVVRVAPLAPLAERLGRLTGLAAVITPALDSIVRTLVGHRAIAAALDPAASVDVAYVLDAHEEPQAVLSFGAGTPEALERALGQTHRLVPLANGVFRIEPQEANGGGEGEEESHDPDAAANRCVVAPTARPGTSRVVCSVSPPALEALTGYMARTLARRTGAADAISIEAFPDVLRAHFTDEFTHALDERRTLFDASIAQDPTGPFHPGPARAALTRVVDAVFADARALLPDASRIETVFTLGDDRLTWRTGVEVRAPHGTLTRALIASLAQPPAVPPELLAHQPAGGYLYAAGALDSRPFQSFTALLVDLGDQVAQTTRGLAPADVTAVHAALAAAVLLDQWSFAQTAGVDEHGQPWLVGVARGHDVPPAQVVTALRTIVAALRRPAVARRAAAVLHALNQHAPDLRALRELPARALPAGAYGVAVPGLGPALFEPLETLLGGGGGSSVALGPPAPAPGAHPHAAHRPLPTQLVVLPSGPDTIVALGEDAAALATRFAANTTPGLEPQTLATPAGGFVAAIVPAGLANVGHGSASPNAPDLAANIARMPDHGRTPVVLRAGAHDAGQGATRLELDVEIRRETLRAIPALIQ